MEDHEPDGNTQYRIGSLTKMFVAVLIMPPGARRGLLDLADPVRQVPGLRRGDRVGDDRTAAVAYSGDWPPSPAGHGGERTPW